MCEMCDEQMRNDTSESLAVTDRADSMLTFDLRAFARNYAGTPFGSRCKTAADELDRLYEVERSRQYWKSMASAPKDGSRFLIERDIPSDTSMSIAFWHDGKDDPGFVHGDSLGRAVDLNIYTMWRPLPHPALTHAARLAMNVRADGTATAKGVE